MKLHGIFFKNSTPIISYIQTESLNAQRPDELWYYQLINIGLQYEPYMTPKIEPSTLCFQMALWLHIVKYVCKYGNLFKISLKIV